MATAITTSDGQICTLYDGHLDGGAQQIRYADIATHLVDLVPSFQEKQQS